MASPLQVLEDQRGSSLLSSALGLLVSEEVTGHRDLINSGPGNRGLSACGTTHEAERW